jgi:hypothetical protein
MKPRHSKPGEDNKIGSLNPMLAWGGAPLVVVGCLFPVFYFIADFAC